MIEEQVDITTPEGEMTTFVFHPEHGGPFPVVLYLMDAPSIRPEGHIYVGSKAPWFEITDDLPQAEEL